jgi:hypothetical protein
MTDSHVLPQWLNSQHPLPITMTCQWQIFKKYLCSKLPMVS